MHVDLIEPVKHSSRGGSAPVYRMKITSGSLKLKLGLPSASHACISTLGGARKLADMCCDMD